MEASIVGLVTTILAGGPPTWIAAGVLAVVGVGVFIWYKSKLRELAERKTLEAKERDQAEGAKTNQDAQKNWDAASEENEETRARYREFFKK